MDKQFDASIRERRLVQERAKLRSQLKTEWMKQWTHPNKFGFGEGGTIFDPVFQRWTALRADQWYYFKPTPYTFLVYPCLVIGASIALGWVITKDREKREAILRRGEVSYRERDFKFI